MLLTKQQRRRQVRRISPCTEYSLKISAHRYRLCRYAELTKLGISEELADKVMDIWQNGCRNKADQLVLDRVAAFLNRVSRQAAHQVPRAA